MQPARPVGRRPEQGGQRIREQGGRHRVGEDGLGRALAGGEREPDGAASTTAADIVRSDSMSEA